ncbi:low temperature-induced protein lt101.2-like [Carex rostrata]
MGSCCMFIEILLAIVLPPLGVFLHYGCCSCEFCICLLLTILGYVPGIIYAIYVLVAERPGRTRYYYFHHGGYIEPLV